jgi:pantoate kinase
MKAKAYSPAGLSSFFEVCDKDEHGNQLRDFRLIGARGGGFLINPGIMTEVNVEQSNKNVIEVYINGKYAPNAITSRKVAQYMLGLMDKRFKIIIKHRTGVPIAMGFGTSGAGALTTSLALSKAFGLNLSMNELGMIAHKAEIECKTGLGTVAPLISGSGCIITVKPGGPGIAIIKKIPLKPNLKLISGVFNTIQTKEILLAKTKLEIINKAGRKALKKILDNPCLENFLEACKNFAIESKLATEKTLKLIKEVENSEAIGVAQNMIGEAVHAVVDQKSLNEVLDIFKRFLPNERIILAEFSFKSASQLNL